MAKSFIIASVLASESLLVAGNQGTAFTKIYQAEYSWGSKYAFYSDKLSFDEARQACQNEQSDGGGWYLAEIMSSWEKDLILQLGKQHVVGDNSWEGFSYWSGAQGGGEYGAWANLRDYRYGFMPANLVDVTSTEPNAYCLQYNAGFLSNKFKNKPCNEKAFYVCEKGTATDGGVPLGLPPVNETCVGDEHWALGQKCYRFFTHQRTYNEARDVCRFQGLDWYLTVPNTDAEQQLVLQIGKEQASSWLSQGLGDLLSDLVGGDVSFFKYWIGIDRLAPNRDWKVHDFTKWIQLPQPGPEYDQSASKNCMANKMGGYVNYDCGQKMNFVCENGRFMDNGVPQGKPFVKESCTSDTKSKCYRFFDEVRTFDESEAACKLQGEGWHLLVPETPQEANYVKNIIADLWTDGLFSLNFWTAIRRTSASADWQTCGPVPFENMSAPCSAYNATEEENCMEYAPYCGSFVNSPCKQRSVFVCEQSAQGDGCFPGKWMISGTSAVSESVFVKIIAFALAGLGARFQ